MDAGRPPWDGSAAGSGTEDKAQTHLSGAQQAGFSAQAKNTDALHPKAHRVSTPQTYEL